MAVAAGWYADPSEETQVRWWSGTGWTEHVAPATPVTPLPSVTPVAGPLSGLPAASAVGALADQESRALADPAAMGSERRSGTVWVWVLAFTPWLWTLTGFFALVTAGSPLDASPWDSYPQVWVPFALTVLFAILDVRQLRTWHGTAAHWTWALLGAPIYIIARTVVLRRRGKFGTAPLWVVLVNMVVALAPFLPLAGLYFVTVLMGLHSFFSGN
ncbi:DUF2510 domain-containing protein [Cryobacterium arcticum]|uniref:DUF2510 domain-containing protein n=1 Tax=Cryobacterium arcticum TaxID=670052 RepID=UPI0015E8310D|nr:DUF2510 domain-containing protein [Cryobacterium arcticum]